jgi:hypothetical protein
MPWAWMSRRATKVDNLSICLFFAGVGAVMLRVQEAKVVY